LLITLKDRLSSNVADQAELRQAAAKMLRSTASSTLDGSHFQMVRKPYGDTLGDASPRDEKQLYAACTKMFGHNTHVAGGMSETGGCLIVMRSEREDDTSKPLLEAMRKAATQFSGGHPAFIAMQIHGISAPDLMLPHLRRRAGILSYALYGHYGADHVNATYICGFASAVYRDGQLGSPAFAIPNPRPRFAVEPQDAAPFLVSISDADYADAIGAPLPQPNISDIPF
jgi:hypothetical protein